MRAQTRDAVVTRSPGRPVSCRSKLVRHTSLPLEGGLGGPLRASPKGPMAPAKPALELGFSDRSPPPSGLVWLVPWNGIGSPPALAGTRSRATSRRMLQIFTHANYDFIGKRRIAYAISIVFTLIALAHLAYKSGLRPGSHFARATP